MYINNTEKLFKTAVDGVDYYVFPSTVSGEVSRGAEDRVNRAINGKDDALIPATTSTDRKGEFIKLNVSRTLVWENVTVDLPTDILSNVNRLNEIDALERKDVTREIADEFLDAEYAIKNYFSRG